MIGMEVKVEGQLHEDVREVLLLMYGLHTLAEAIHACRQGLLGVHELTLCGAEARHRWPEEVAEFVEPRITVL